MAGTGERSSTGNTCTSDIDAITPCPPPPGLNQMQIPHPPCNDSAGLRQSRSPSPSSCSESEPETQNRMNSSRRSSLKILENGTDGDPERLWKRMLALQQVYGCYRSARMSAALELNDATFLLPTKACLDLLNEDMEALPTGVMAVLDSTTR